MRTLRPSDGVCCSIDLWPATEDFTRWPSCVSVGVVFCKNEGNDKRHGGGLLNLLTEAFVYRL